VKFDGYRIQIHKRGDAVTVYSRRGYDFTRRFPDIASAARRLRVESVIIDAELTAVGADGRPDFNALVRGEPLPRIAWAFDLLDIDGRDLRPLVLGARRAVLGRLLARRRGSSAIRLSETFTDGHALLEECCRRGLEGVVAKRADRPYRSGRSQSWVKVKCPGWQASRVR